MALLREPSGSHATTAQIRAAGGPRAALADLAGLFADQAEAAATREIARWREQGITTLSYDDPDFPARLGRLEDPPALLFRRGNPEVTDDDGIAVIGTRRPTRSGLQVAGEVTEALVAAGQTVISGLAAGIDTAAHEMALRAGGRSVAVLGNGLQHVYPAANAELQRRLQVVVSQFWPEQRPARESFPRRNAVMSGISRATVIIEAGERSGVRIQARHALAQGRAVVLMAPLLRQEWARALAQNPGVCVIDGADDLWVALGAR